VLWEKYRSDYPKCREVAPLTPTVERFEKPAPVELRFADVPPLPRVWFVHANDNGIIQVQRDRFLHNWKKVRPEDEYPRYPKVIEMFQDRLSQFEAFLRENDLGVIEPVQYEMTYINHIPQGEGWTTLNEIGKVFPDFALRADQQRFLPEPEGINWRTSFALPEQAGRLHVKIQHGKHRETQQPILVLDLTVRGIGADRSVEGMKEWFDLAREWIVCGFADLTSEDVQRDVWRRIQS
jgi:uncharacterized protein (TIGR04255 family)